MNKTIHIELTEGEVDSLTSIMKGRLEEYLVQRQDSDDDGTTVHVENGLSSIRKILSSLE